jgi:hypothetical protein
MHRFTFLIVPVAWLAAVGLLLFRVVRGVAAYFNPIAHYYVRCLRIYMTDEGYVWAGRQKLGPTIKVGFGGIVLDAQPIGEYTITHRYDVFDIEDTPVSVCEFRALLAEAMFEDVLLARYIEPVESYIDPDDTFH